MHIDLECGNSYRRFSQHSCSQRLKKKASLVDLLEAIDLILGNTPARVTDEVEIRQLSLVSRFSDKIPVLRDIEQSHKCSM